MHSLIVEQALHTELWRYHCDMNLFFNEEQQCSDHTFLLHLIRWNNKAHIFYLATVECLLIFGTCFDNGFCNFINEEY